MKKTFAATLLASSLSLLGCGDDDPQTSTQLDKQITIQEMTGLWRSDGYHYLWEITGSQVREYQLSSAHCLLITESTITEFEVINPHLYTNINRNRFATDEDNASEEFHPYYFDRIDEKPDVCINGINERTDDLVDNFEVFWNFFNEQYAFFQLREVDWQEQYNDNIEAVRQAENSEELFEIMAEMIEYFGGDGHVTLEADTDELEAEADGGELSNIEEQVIDAFDESISEEKLLNSYQTLLASEEYQELPDSEKYDDFYEYVGALIYEFWDELLAVAEETVDNYMTRGELSSAANDNLSWGIIEGKNIGYLRLDDFIEFIEIDDDIWDALSDGSLTIDGLIDLMSAALNNGLDTAMTDLVDTDAIILDIRLNNGGFDVLGLQVASRFFDKERLVFNKQARTLNGFTDDTKIYLSPSTTTPYTKPIYVLMSSETLSAAETFALAMSSLPYVTFVGEPSFGNLSDPLAAHLPNGWEVELSNEIYSNTNHESFEGIGIPVNIEASFLTAEMLEQQKDAGIEAVIQHRSLL